MDNTITQTLYLAIDDSGQLSKRDNIMVFGGIVFFTDASKDRFIQKYSNLVNNMKCHYCYFKRHCNNHCPELKHSNIKLKHKLEFLKVIKNEYLIGAVIDTTKIYPGIMSSSKAKGRFLDYGIKMLIKNCIKSLIKQNIINPNNDLKIIIHIDESNFKTNGYYNLKESIYEELTKGIGNIKNNIHFKNIIHGNLEIVLTYDSSSLSYLIQSSDLIAGSIRSDLINNKKYILNNINDIIKLP